MRAEIARKFRMQFLRESAWDGSWFLEGIGNIRPTQIRWSADGITCTFHTISQANAWQVQWGGIWEYEFVAACCWSFPEIC